MSLHKIYCLPGQTTQEQVIAQEELVLLPWAVSWGVCYVWDQRPSCGPSFQALAIVTSTSSSLQCKKRHRELASWEGWRRHQQPNQPVTSFCCWLNNLMHHVLFPDLFTLKVRNGWVSCAAVSKLVVSLFSITFFFFQWIEFWDRPTELKIDCKVVQFHRKYFFAHKGLWNCLGI